MEIGGGDAGREAAGTERPRGGEREAAALRSPPPSPAPPPPLFLTRPSPRPQSTAKEAARANDELSAACEALEASSVDVEPALLRLLALSELTKKLVAGVAKLDDI